MNKQIKIISLIAMMSLSFSSVAGVHWGYEGDEKPDNWGKLSADYQMCELGKINLR